MATFTKHFLSASTSGRPITITGTTAAGATAIHVGPSGTGIDEVWAYASLSGPLGSTMTASLLWGSAASGGQINFQVTAGQPTLLAPGWTISDSTISGFTTSGSTVVVTGYVNRIS